MLSRIKYFFNERDPDLEIFCQVFCMFVANFIGLLLWLVIRLPCTMLIVLAPGIIVAIVFGEKKYGRIIKISFKTAFIIALFFVLVIMLNSYPLFVLIWVFLFVYIFFSSAKNRYLISFAILPCSLAFNINIGAGALSAANTFLEAFISALITIVAVVLVKELTSTYRIKKVSLLLVEEIYNLLDRKSHQYNQLDLIRLSELRVKTLTLKAFNLIDKERYCLERNKKNAALYNKILKHLLKVSRSILIIKQSSEESNNTYTVYILDILREIKEILKQSSIQDMKLILPEFPKEEEFTRYCNYFAVKNLLEDFSELKKEFCV